MSLRFLTRRRDRSNSTSNSLDSKPSSSSPLLSPHDPFAKGKSAVPAQVQIISWHPRDLESSGRQVHIRSRADDTCSATPVYHAFTASSVRRGSEILTPPQASSTSSHSSPRHAPRHVQQTRVEASAATSRARLTSASSRSYDDQCSKPDSLHLKHPVSRLVASTLLDTPRSEHVELLQPSWPTPDRDAQEQRSSLIHSHTTPRPAESLPHHTKTAGYDDTLTDTEDASIYSRMPSSSRSHFASIHPSASVASLASFLSLGGGSKDTPAPASTELTKTASSSSSSFNNTLLSRTPSTRRLRRSTNASSADIQISASSTESGAGPSVAPEMIASRSRSSSLSSLTPKFLRSKQGAQAPSTPSGKSKRSRGAPPSAWRSDIASTATADMTSADAGGASSTYSSDNQGSSHGHGHQQEHTSSSTLGHLLSKVAVSAHVRKSSADAASDRFYHRSPAPNTHRPLTATIGTSSSPLLASSITAVDSPIISGLPLPDPTPASISLLVTSQLFKRLGPPPVGLEPHCFHERVALIQGYVQSQVPPPPCPKSPPQGVQRASLPPPPRKRRDVAALEDEFDKLECLAEVEMAKFASAGGVGLEELRLEEAFLEARRRSGVDWSRSHFELRSAVGAGSPRMRDAVPPGVSTSAGLGLLTHKDVSGAEGGLGVSLKPAPRTRRRPVIVGADAEDGKGKRPTTAPETEQACIAAKSNFTSPRRREEGAGQRELFTPQSFSFKPHQLHNTSIVDEARLHSPLSPLSQLLPLTQNPAPSSYTPTSGSGKQRRGSSDRDSSSSHTHQSNSSAATSTQSPLFWNHHHAFRGGGRLKKGGGEMDEGTEEGEGDETEDTTSCESLSDATKVVQQQQALGDGVIW
ncbi:hypothetical protein NDA10_002216 [Ustilago hordei]|uniref:Uncharacterized protein n=1 Tax=Ustilago hordei TaxID=120017 RepID=I2FNB6_USTHO|nr:uncharacterized protein UHO2_07073 [Ustilago hordei]KAJ1038687.1 hypothetical protein NDA10_002216 [Ustilago hordei]KAJ1591338.1 hypothetical protein NDA15_000147 [Ustilago hordei]CCF48409.1 uncharacterized protein UHOR_08936 [Ustilago hordei]SYW81165.1 uncharacterized protein UHO2_07073 [Ustilago hordei]